MSVRASFVSLAFVITSMAASVAAAATPHPLDPLSAEEVTRSLTILKQSGKLTESTLFPYLMLREPPKKEVLAWKVGQPFRREALAVVYDHKAGKTAEATIDLRTNAIADGKSARASSPPCC